MFKPSLHSLLQLSLLLCCSLPLSAAHRPALPLAPDGLNGPMIGSVEMTEVRLWVQGHQSETLQLEYWPVDQPQHKRRTAPQTTRKEDSYSLLFVLSQLEPQTQYRYQVLRNGQVAPQSTPLSFRTLNDSTPINKVKPAPHTLQVALGSCVYLNDAGDPQPGKDFPIFQSIFEQRPDLMLWLGDNIYLRPRDYYSEAGMDFRYRQLRALPSLQGLMGNLPHYAIWDDHDYGDNDAESSYRLRPESFKLFQRYWANPSYGTPEAPGVFSYFEREDAAFFLTDNRYYRAANDNPDPNRSYFGAQQWQWLKDALSTSPARFKFLVMGNQILNTQSPTENMHSYTRAYAEFLNWLREDGPPGVMILSGDRHHSELLKRERPGRYPLYEWTVSPLVSKAYPPFPVESEIPERVAKSLRVEQNFGMLKLSGPAHQRQIELTLHNAQGKKIWSQQISDRELGYHSNLK